MTTDWQSLPPPVADSVILSAHKVLFWSLFAKFVLHDDRHLPSA